MGLLAEGETAPDFSLSDCKGQPHSLKANRATYRVVYFYPKDNTPGCTMEAIEFSQSLGKFKKCGAEIIGISGGDEKSKTKFCDKHGLKILLLSDTDFSVSKRYGVYGPKKFMGRTFNGISRTTFVLGKSGRIIKVFQKVKPEGHATEVLDFLTTFKSAPDV